MSARHILVSESVLYRISQLANEEVCAPRDESQSIFDYVDQAYNRAFRRAFDEYLLPEVLHCQLVLKYPPCDFEVQLFDADELPVSLYWKSPLLLGAQNDESPEAEAPGVIV